MTSIKMRIDDESTAPETPSFEYTAGQGGLREGLDDIRDGLSRTRLITTMVGNDFSSRYKGTLLGAFWLTATALMTVLGLGLIYSQVFQTDFKSYLPFVALGMMIWGVISSIITEGTGVFSNARGVFTQMRVPLSLFAFTLIGRAIVTFFFRGIVIVPLLFIKGDAISFVSVLEAVAGLALLFWIGLWAAFPLGMLGARFRDTSQFTSAFVTFAFFVTPVFWQADRLGAYSYLIDFNPLFHFINVVRGPLLSEPQVAMSFMVTAAFAVVMPMIALVCLAAFRRRLPYW
ncbi:ABC transporter permease [Hyphomonas sp.]|uniref:ABC transporter permease n=1 Tax=Hyphomonas sp. TaxID=87 RepID=UPI003F6EE998|tara:strand:+ start:10311 stop:11174 length:864 start_codon:yes stop_codon:yes gene_type:complete